MHEGVEFSGWEIFIFPDAFHPPSVDLARTGLLASIYFGLFFDIESRKSFPTGK